jgi:flagellar protein FlaG
MINPTGSVQESKTIGKIKPVSREHPSAGSTDHHTLKRHLSEKNDLVTKAKKMTKEQLEEVIRESNRMIFEDNKKFAFTIHEGTGRFLVRLVDQETNEVIREIPPEKLLDLVANIWEMVGILVDERG